MKKYDKYTFVFVFAAVLFFSGLTNVKGQGFGDRNRAGGDGSFNVQGRIVMPDGKPAVGVRVSMNGADFSNGSTQTDYDGNFNISNIPAGNYSIVVRGTAEYESDSESLTIERFAPPGQTFNVAFFLRPVGVKKSELNPTNNPLLADIPKEALKKHNSAAESMQKNDAKTALLRLDEAIALYPDFALAYNEKGMLLLRQNELDKALEAFLKAIQIKQDYFDAKLNFGFTLLSQRNYEQAEMVLRDLLQQKAEMPTLNMYLGIALIGLKKTDEAEKSFKKAVTLKGGENLAQAHKYLGGIYLQKKNNAEAIVELQKYVDLSPKAADAEKVRATIEDLKKQTAKS